MAELRTRPQSSRAQLQQRRISKRRASRAKRLAQLDAAERRRQQQLIAQQESRYQQAAREIGAYTPAPPTDTVGAPIYNQQTATPQKNVLDDFLSGYAGPGQQMAPEELEELPEEEGGFEFPERDQRESRERQEPEPNRDEEQTPEVDPDAPTVLDEANAPTVLDEANVPTVLDRPEVDPDAPTVVDPDAPTLPFDAADAPTVKSTQQAPSLHEGAKTDLAKPPVPETAGKGAAKAGKEAAETGARAAAEGAKGAAADVAGSAAKGAAKEGAEAAAKGAAKAAGKTAAKEGAKTAVKGAATAAGTAAGGVGGVVAGAVVEEGFNAAEAGSKIAKKAAAGDIMGALSTASEFGSEEFWRWFRRLSLADTISGITGWTYAFVGMCVAIFQIHKTLLNPKGAMKGAKEGNYLKGFISFLEPPAIKPTNFEEVAEVSGQAMAGCAILLAVFVITQVLMTLLGIALVGTLKGVEVLSPIAELFF